MDVFRTRLRRVGNSLGILVPKEVAQEIPAKEGDEVEVALRPTQEERRRRLQALIGSSPGLRPYDRERRDRY